MKKDIGEKCCRPDHDGVCIVTAHSCKNVAQKASI